MTSAAERSQHIITIINSAEVVKTRRWNNGYDADDADGHMNDVVGSWLLDAVLIVERVSFSPNE